MRSLLPGAAVGAQDAGAASPPITAAPGVHEELQGMEQPRVFSLFLAIDFVQTRPRAPQGRALL